MKAILVIDIPNENLWRTSNDIYERMKGYKCSLKPMPAKHDNVPKHEYELGWNDCIEEIEG